ncbi:MAG: xanthine dehydrogenase family protein molybdopterin-binding subunit [Actinomycetota bacterium]
MSVTPGPTLSSAATTHDFRTVGKRAIHGEFLEKVRGSLPYADDWHMPGMLYGKVVRAQVPCARIVSLDLSEAAGLPGVVAVLTADDVPNNLIAEEASGLGMTPVAMPVLAADRVRYAGEPVALIAAESPEVAEEAAELLVVEYEEIPSVFSAERALEPDAPLVHAGGNTLVEWRIHRGDAQQTLRNAPVVVEGTYKSQRVDHAYLEPEAGVGWVDGDGVITLRVATQVIEHWREVARILDVPRNSVRVIGTYMGGGFGGKEDMTIEPHLALLVWRTRRPVKMVWSRQESLLGRWKRHPFVMHYRTGATRDGRILAQSIRILADGGAYPLLSPRVLFAAAVTAAGPYRTPEADIVSTAVFTNTVPSSAMRGFGAMQVVLAYEAQMDRLAESVGVTPEEIRERNFVRRGDTLPTGEALETYVGIAETMRAALDDLGPPGRGTEGLRVGRGFACNMQPYGRARYFSDSASCWMTLEPNGSLLIRIGVTDLGGGQAASLCQVASEVLGVPLEKISIHIADSALTPLAGGTFATRQLYMSGNAVLKTAAELKERLIPVAADLLGADDRDVLMFGDGTVALAGSDRFVSLGEVVRACGERGVSCEHLGTFRAETGDFDPRTGQGKTFPDYTYGTHAVEVAVDPETGSVEVLRYVACHDVGRAINPLRVEGQIQGGVAQGIGYALSEEVRVVDGTTVPALFADYLIPASTDLPDIRPIVLELGEGKGPFGARGIGEPSIAPCAAAIASAVADAVGVRITELPIGPERILDALRTAPAVSAGP